MKIIPLLLLVSLPAAALEFNGSPEAVIEIVPETSTGLEAVYVLGNTTGVRAIYSGTDAATARWSRFSNLGGAYAESITSTVDGNTSSIVLDGSDMGYIVEAGGRQHCFWVINYSIHELQLASLAPSAEQDCGRMRLVFTGNASEIPYYTINGRRMILSRQLEMDYTTLTFDEDSFTYRSTETTEELDAIETETSVPAPLCSTTFRLSGDRFTRTWGREQSIESITVQPTAVEANTRATQDTRTNDNEQKDGTDGLGGSAPCDITFEAAVTDAAIFHEWQISRSSEFDINELTFTELEFSYTFREQGTTFVRLLAADADGTCEFAGPTYEIFIGESKLEIPNAFSPKSSPGVNDEWKVSYKSLISFECHIFNRWGTELFSSTDPAIGWDGRHGGKFVPAGVYYYVIEAEGADGVKYKRSGDINIIDFSEERTSDQTSD